MLQKTPTQTPLQRLGVSLASRCNLCLTDVESVPHLFFQCRVRQSTWQWIFHLAGVLAPVHESPSVIWNFLSVAFDSAAKKYMAFVFLNVIYSLRMARNDVSYK